MSAIFTIVFVLTAFLLIGIILIQQPKTAGGLFSGTGQSLLGTSGKTFWTKFTVILVSAFMGICLLMSALPNNKQSQSSVADIIEKQQQQTAAQQAAPPTGAADKTQPAPQAPSGASVPAPQKAPVAAGATKK